MPCPEEGCGGVMVLRHSPKYNRKFYGCSNFPDCKAAHGAHPDGSPLGVPADKATKAARIQAHEAFDKLWESALDLYTFSRRPSRKHRRGIIQIARRRAYTWLQERLGMTPDDCHIGRFDIETCERVVVACDGVTPADVRAWAKERGL